MKQQKNKKVLNEVLNYSNTEIISYLLRLSKLVKAFEGITWENAQQKARKLIYENNAIQYIDSIREQLTTSIISTPEVKQAIEVSIPVNNEKPKVVPPIILDNSVLNYQALIDLAPDLLTRIVQKGKYYGVARKRGYKSISLELLTKDRSGYYFELITHKNNVGDGVYIQFDFHLDTVNERIEMLSFSDNDTTIEVYQSRTKRTTVTTKEREDQNAYLFARLSDFVGWELVFNSEKSPKVIEQKELKKRKIKESKELRAQQKELKEYEQFINEINEHIPAFQSGKVRLCKAHKKAGILQQHIDLINQRRSGLILCPIRLDQQELDKLTPIEQLKRKGKRVNKWGKVFHKTRSQMFDENQNVA